MSDFTNNSELDEFDGLAEKIEDERQIFRRFKPKRIAACDWINDLIKNGHRSAERRGRRSTAVEEGLFMSDEMQDVGILSVAPALSALLFELKQLRANVDTKKGGVTFADMLTADRGRVLNVVTGAVCKIIVECYPNGVSGGYRNVLLSSMPFYDDSASEGNNGWDCGGYLDTASWVFLAADSIESFLTRLEKEAPEVYAQLEWKNKNPAVSFTTDEVKSIVRDIYLGCIRVACDCIVRDESGNALGWSFRKMGRGAEPSLYFSYVASTIYLGLYKRFNGTDEIVDKLRGYEKAIVESKNEELHKLRFFEGINDPAMREITISSLERNGQKGFANFLRGLKSETLDELDLLYNKINDGTPLTYKIANDISGDGSFTMLKKASIRLAEQLWMEGFGPGKHKKPFSENMAKGPCFEDGSLVDMNVIRLSSHNNAFFNNLFVIGIILNSAYDEEIKARSRVEYDRMLNIFQLAIQNTQRCYNEIESEGLLYKIDSYILDFSDKVDADNKELAKQLRKVNIAAVPLMPLILKNNNLMSQYVIKYPQKEMTESLKDIIRNKKRKDGVRSWVWDKDGYNAITNYYYVDALISFYLYYEEYEERFIANEEDKIRNEQKAVAAAREDIEREFRKREDELAASIREKDAYIAEVRGLSRSIAKFVVNAVIDLIDEQLTPENLIGSLGDARMFRTAVIQELNSKDKDTDTVKLSKLVHLLEKLQLLSLLSMEDSEHLSSILHAVTTSQTDAYSLIIADEFGKKGNISRLISNLVKLIAPVPVDSDGEGK